MTPRAWRRRTGAAGAPRFVGIDTEWAADLAVDADEQALGLSTGRGGRAPAGRSAGGVGADLARGARTRNFRARGGDGDNLSADEAETAEEEETEEIEETEAELRTTQKDASSVVALLQVASATRVFLLDFPALLERCPALIAPTLGALLADDAVLKAGFGVAEDLRRLAALHGGVRRVEGRRAGRRRRSGGGPAARLGGGDARPRADAAAAAAPPAAADATVVLRRRALRAAIRRAATLLPRTCP